MRVTGRVLASVVLFVTACSGMAPSTTSGTSLAPPTTLLEIPSTTMAAAPTTTTLIPHACPTGFEYVLGRDGEVSFGISPLKLASALVRISDLEFLGCQDKAGYESEAPQELWFPEECVDLASGETTTTSQLSADLGSLLYLKCEQVEEMWHHYTQGREALACHLLVRGSVLIGLELYEDYSRDMASCAEVSFVVDFWIRYGPGPDLIPVSDLD